MLLSRRSEPVGPTLKASELYRFFHAGDDETFALRGVSLAVHPGEMVAIVGPSGSGKSTLLACLAGLDEPDGGYVEVMGQRITRRPEVTRARLRAMHIGMLMQSGNLLDHLTVAGNVHAAQGLSAAATADPATLLADVGLEHRRAAWPSTLSGGEAARASLAVALSGNPTVLLADEPTGEVDAASEGVVLEILGRHAARGCSVVVVTHSERVADAAHRVVRLTDGRVVDA